MKAVISSLLITATAVANAAYCDLSVLIKISEATDAVECKNVCNFVVPVESTEDTILINLESFCGNVACQRVLTSLAEIPECLIDDANLHKSVIDPITAVCSTIRAQRAADGSHVHSSGMDMGSSTTETEDSDDATPSSTNSSGAEYSHDATSTSSEVYDSHDTASLTPVAAGGDDDDDSNDTVSSSSAASSKAMSNSTSSTPAPNASTSSAASATFAAGSVFLAAAIVFLSGHSICSHR